MEIRKVIFASPRVLYNNFSLSNPNEELIENFLEHLKLYFHINCIKLSTDRLNYLTILLSPHQFNVLQK